MSEQGVPRLCIGTVVSGPGIPYRAVICHVDANGNVYAMWGDNNRCRYTPAQQGTLTVVTEVPA